MKSKNYIRIGNIELQYSEFNGCEEIVKWEPNPHYGKLDEYVECKDNPGFYSRQEDIDKGHKISIAKGCFEHPETCFVLSFVDWNRAHDEMDIRSVGSRPFDLDEDEEKNYKEIVLWAFKHIDMFSDELEKDPTKYKRPWELKDKENGK